MADAKYITIRGTDYTIHDPNALPKAGGTMTGSVTMTSGGYLRINDNFVSGTTPSTSVWGGGVRFCDSAGTVVGSVRSIYRGTRNAQNTADETVPGLMQTELSCQRSISGNTVSNYLRVNIDTDGSMGVSVANSEAWRNALGASNGVWPVSAGGIGGTAGSWQTVTHSTFSGNWKGTVRYRKVGFLCCVTLDAVCVQAQGKDEDSSLILTLPEGYRPLTYSVSAYCGSWGLSVPAMMMINSNGEIRIGNSQGGALESANLRGSIMFFCA